MLISKKCIYSHKQLLFLVVNLKPKIIYVAYIIICNWFKNGWETGSTNTSCGVN